MKRDFLKNLGIEDKEIIDKIMDENSSDIGKTKGEVDTLKTEISDLKGQLTDKDTEIADLKKSIGDTDALTTKITELETSNTDYVKQIADLKKDHAIENGLRDAKAKNIKAVKALLDMEKITLGDDGLKGLDEQLKTLTEGDSTAFLFGEGTTTTTPSGTNPSNPPSEGDGDGNTGKSFTDAIAAYIGGKN